MTPSCVHLTGLILTLALVMAACGGSQNQARPGVLSWDQPALRVSFSEKISPRVDQVYRRGTHARQSRGAVRVMFSEPAMVYAIENRRVLNKPGRPYSAVTLLIVPADEWRDIDDYMHTMADFDVVKDLEDDTFQRIVAPRHWTRTVVRRLHVSQDQKMMSDEETGEFYCELGGSADMLQEIFIYPVDNHVIVVGYLARVGIQNTVQTFTSQLLNTIVLEE